MLCQLGLSVCILLTFLRCTISLQRPHPFFYTNISHMSQVPEATNPNSIWHAPRKGIPFYALAGDTCCSKALRAKYHKRGTTNAATWLKGASVSNFNLLPMRVKYLPCSHSSGRSYLRVVPLHPSMPVIHDVPFNYDFSGALAHYSNDRTFGTYLTLRQEIFYDHRHQPKLENLYAEAKWSFKEWTLQTLKVQARQDGPLMLEYCLRLVSC